MRTGLYQPLLARAAQRAKDTDMPPMDLDTEKSGAAPTDTDRDIRVTFAQEWAYAYAGVEVVRFAKGEVADISKTCHAVAEKEGIKFKSSPDEKETWAGKARRLDDERKAAAAARARGNR
jgi:hypothetical protein